MFEDLVFSGTCLLSSEEKVEQGERPLKIQRDFFSALLFPCVEQTLMLHPSLE